MGPFDKDVITGLEYWAARTPEHPAYVGERTLTYKELWQESDAVAEFVHSRVPQEKPRSPIVVRGHKEPEMLIACIGALKAGHAYVPIDTVIPEDRAAYMTEASRAAMVLTPDQVAAITSKRPGTKGAEWRAPQGDEPFYSMFTSGSTGRPKGVVVTADNVNAFLRWMLEEQHFALQSEVFLDQVSYSFDVSAMSIFPCLMTGGTLFAISKEDVAEPARLYRSLARSGVTTWVSTPSFARLCLAEKTFAQTMLPQLKRFMFCGETLAPHLASELLRRFPGAEVWNTYGPTETTVAVTSVRVDRELIARYDRIPLGYAKPREAVRIVQENGAEAPAGESGEIVICGPQVSSGYLGNAELNRAVFSDTGGIRSYRTGDRGYMRDNLLFFEGRLDDQIKLHGYRIELADIEANIRELPGVQDAIVVVVKENEVPSSLVACVILAPGNADGAAGARTLRTQLQKHLPQYMVPRTIRFFERFPETSNGKADRARLAVLVAV